MNCTHPRYSAQILAWLEGGLAAGEAAEVEAHVGACGACQDEVAYLRQVSRKVASAFQVQKMAPLPSLCPDPDQLVAFAEKALEPDPTFVISEHLLVCPPCADEVGLLMELEAGDAMPGGSVSADGQEPLASLVLRRAFEAEFRATTAGTTSPLRGAEASGVAARLGLWAASARRPLGAVATLAVIFGVSWLFINKPEMVLPPPSAPAQAPAVATRLPEPGSAGLSPEPAPRVPMVSQPARKAGASDSRDKKDEADVAIVPAVKAGARRPSQPPADAPGADGQAESPAVVDVSRPASPSAAGSASAPRPAAPSAPGPATASTPRPAVASAPGSALPSAPRPAVASVPGSALPSAPRPGAASAPGSALPSAPRPAVTSAPRSALPSAPRPAVTSAPGAAAPSAPRPAVPPAPRPAAAPAPRSAVASVPLPAASTGGGAPAKSRTSEGNEHAARPPLSAAPRPGGAAARPAPAATPREASSAPATRVMSPASPSVRVSKAGPERASVARTEEGRTAPPAPPKAAAAHPARKSAPSADQRDSEKAPVNHPAPSKGGGPQNQLPVFARRAPRQQTTDQVLTGGLASQGRPADGAGQQARPSPGNVNAAPGGSAGPPMVARRDVQSNAAIPSGAVVAQKAVRNTASTTAAPAPPPSQQNQTAWETRSGGDDRFRGSGSGEWRESMVTRARQAVVGTLQSDDFAVQLSVVPPSARRLEDVRSIRVRVVVPSNTGAGLRERIRSAVTRALHLNPSRGDAVTVTAP